MLLPLSSRHTISKQYIAQFLPENPIIIEAGAHKGIDTLKMHALWPQATIHVFEPVPALYEQLKANTQHITTIHCYPYALSNKNSIQPLYISSGIDAVSSLLKPTDYFNSNPAITFTTHSVESITLNTWAQRYHITYIDFMWLDAQGHELEILKGAGDLLQTLTALLTEISVIERYHDNIPYHSLRLWLESYNFSLQAEALGKKGWGNALFIKK